MAMTNSSNWMTESVYSTTLAGQYEVPPVDTSGRGSALFRRVGTDRMSYAVDVMGLTDITQAHIHQGRTGRNGPVVAWLYGPSQGTSVSGLLARGTLRSSDLVGPLRGKSISTLERMMRAGNAYVNVHTTRYPEGAVRGQVRAAGRTTVSVSGDWWQYGGTSFM